MNRYVLAAGVAALSLVVASCSSSSKSSPSASASTSTSAATSAATSAPASGAASSAGGTSLAPAASGIVINSFSYSGTMTVQPGQKVTVTNNDSVAHTLTDKKTHLFDTGNIDANGGTGTFTAPTKPGSYQFGCKYHPDMSGTLVVQG